MKRLLSYTLLIAACACSSCEKSSLVDYTQPDMIYINKDVSSAAKDSISYSFAIKSPTLTYDTIFIPLRIMGTAKDRDREVTWAPVDSLTTAVAGKDYEVLPTAVRAGSYTASIPVKVLRNPALKTKQVKLMVEIRESKDFKPGIANSREAGQRYLVKINDYLTKPDNWDSWLVYFFGDYSQVKYAFIIQVTGRAVFPSGYNGLPYTQYLYFQTVCRNALDEYEAAHGTLTDESGNPVSF